MFSRSAKSELSSDVYILLDLFEIVLGVLTENVKKKYWMEFYLSGGELLELRLLDTHLLDTFGSKSIARHKFYHLLESS